MALNVNALLISSKNETGLRFAQIITGALVSIIRCGKYNPATETNTENFLPVQVRFRRHQLQGPCHLVPASPSSISSSRICQTSDPDDRMPCKCFY